MDIDDFFENKNRYHHNNRIPKYHDDNKNYHESHNYDSQFNWLKLLNKISNNKRLKHLLIFGLVLIIVIAIILIVVLLPVIMKVLNFLMENGIQGLIDYAKVFIDQILYGKK
jgi:hypothetical protein